MKVSMVFGVLLLMFLSVFAQNEVTVIFENPNQLANPLYTFYYQEGIDTTAFNLVDEANKATINNLVINEQGIVLESLGNNLYQFKISVPANGYYFRVGGFVKYAEGESSVAVSPIVKKPFEVIKLNFKVPVVN